MVKQGAEEEIKRSTPVIERKREWEHGDSGLIGCSRKAKPIFTAPNRIPDECRNYGCNNNDWRSNGIVLREVKGKKIVHREGVKA